MNGKKNCEGWFRVNGASLKGHNGLTSCTFFHEWNEWKNVQRVRPRPQLTSDITRTRTYPTFWSSFVRTYLPTPTRPYGIFKSHFLLELSTVYQIFVQCVLELWKKCKKCCESTKKVFFVDSQQFFFNFLLNF